MTDISTRWQEVSCMDCGERFKDPREAIIQNDLTNGGLMGRHKVCPPKLDAAVQPIAAKPENP